MKVSVITAFYCGNSYMEQYVDCLYNNRENLSVGDELEILLINDSPQEEVLLPKKAAELPLRVYTQSENGGIHKARVRGLEESCGEYVMFLDQDDVLEDNAIAKHLERVRGWREHIKKWQTPNANFVGTGLEDLMMNPVSVSNAQLEQKDGSKPLWYRSDFHKGKIGDYKTYLKVGVQIISPGQCLLPKALIPKVWKTQICKKNGSDDYYLWLLLLARKIPFLLVDEPLYVHKYTGRNLSGSTKNTDASTYEFLDYLRQDVFVREKDVLLLERMTGYKDTFRSGNGLKKIGISIKNLDLFLTNLLFKIRSKTPYGFNRE